MGGAAKHLQHVVDNWDLTFGEIKEILTAASEGRLERTTEKLDGQSLSFSYDVGVGEIRCARNTGDIRSGGMDPIALAAKFRGRGNVEEAFTQGFTTVARALTGLSEGKKEFVFGPETNRWYTIEIIYTNNPNVFNYDSNNIVLHMSPVITIDREMGEIDYDTSGSSEGLQTLLSNIGSMQAALDSADWKINGPKFVQLKRLSDGSVLERSLSDLDRAMDLAGVDDSDTLGTYVRTLVRHGVVDELDIPDDAKDALTSRIVGDEGSDLSAIKRMVPKSEVPRVRELVGASDDIVKELVRPVEMVVHRLAVEVLRGLHSTLIADDSREVERIRGEVKRAISAIESSGSDEAMAVLRDQMEKLSDVDDIASAMEGVVFIYKGLAYKLTGSFSCANQILGLFKYGRGKIKPMRTESRQLTRRR